MKYYDDLIESIIKARPDSFEPPVFLDKNKLAIEHIEDRIQDAFDEAINIHLEHELELHKRPDKQSYLKRFYGNKIGAITRRRQRLQHHLNELRENNE